MVKYVDVAGVGLIGFDDGATEEDIASSLSSPDFQAAFPDAFPTPPPRTPTQTAGDALARGVDVTQQLGYGLTALLGDLIGADQLRDWGIEGYKAQEEEIRKNPQSVPSYKNIEDLGDFGTYALESVAENLPLFVPTLGSGFIGATIAKKVAANVIEKTVAAEMAKGLTRELAEKAVAGQVNKQIAKGAILGAAPASVGMNAAEIYGSMVDETGEGAPGLALAAGSLGGALDLIPNVALIKKVMGPAGTNRWVSRFGRGFFEQFMMEAPTEALQTVIQKGAQDIHNPSKDHFSPDDVDEIIDSALRGGLAGGVIGGTFSAFGKVKVGNDEIDTENIKSTLELNDPNFGKTAQVGDRTGTYRGSGVVNGKRMSFVQFDGKLEAIDPDSVSFVTEEEKPKVAVDENGKPLKQLPFYPYVPNFTHRDLNSLDTPDILYQPAPKPMLLLPAPDVMTKEFKAHVEDTYGFTPEEYAKLGKEDIMVERGGEPTQITKQEGLEWKRLIDYNWATEAPEGYVAPEAEEPVPPRTPKKDADPDLNDAVKDLFRRRPTDKMTKKRIADYAKMHNIDVDTAREQMQLLTIPEWLKREPVPANKVNDQIWIRDYIARQAALDEEARISFGGTQTYGLGWQEDFKRLQKLERETGARVQQRAYTIPGESKKEYDARDRAVTTRLQAKREELNTLRQRFGLKPVQYFTQAPSTNSKTILGNLARKYGSNTSLDPDEVYISNAALYMLKNMSSTGAPLPDNYKEVTLSNISEVPPNIRVPVEKLLRTYGFRAITLYQQVHLTKINKFVEELEKFTKALKLPADAVSLSGILSLNLADTSDMQGAYGRYKSSTKSIFVDQENLGAFYHEWWHALDNYFTYFHAKEAYEMRLIGSRKYYTSGVEVEDLLQSNVRIDMHRAFQRLRWEIKHAGGYVDRSVKLDRQIQARELRNNRNFSRTLEMAARAFQSYIEDVAPKISSNLDLLSKLPEAAFPMGSERKAINAAFQNLFQTLRVRKDTPSSKSVLYSINGENKSPQEIYEAENLQDSLRSWMLQKLDNIVGPQVVLEFVNSFGAGWDSKILGDYDTKTRVMRVALQFGKEVSVETLGHETIHALRNMGMFTDQEWNMLRTHARKTWIKEFNINQNYRDLPQDIREEEAIAHAFGSWFRDKHAAQYEHLFDRIAKFFVNLYDWLVGNNLTTAEIAVDKLFSQIDAGKLRNRTPQFADDITGLQKSQSEQIMRAGMANKDKRYAIGNRVLPHQMSWFGKIFNSMHHMAARSPAWARVYLPIKQMRNDRMLFANRAHSELKALGELNDAQYETFKLAAEIAQMIPGQYRKDAAGNITFVNGPDAGHGKDSKLQPFQIVVLSGKTADAYEQTQKAMNLLLDEIKNAHLTQNLNIFNDALRAIGLGTQLVPSDVAAIHYPHVNALYHNLEDKLNHILQNLPTPRSSWTAAQKAEVEILKDNLKKFGQIRTAVGQMARLRKTDYFPQSRFGSAFISVYDPADILPNGNPKPDSRAKYFETLEFNMFDTPGAKSKKAADRLRILRQRFPGMHVMQPGHMSYDFLRAQYGKDMEMGLDLAWSLLSTEDQKLYEKVHDDLLDKLNLRGFQYHFRSRDKIAGYDTDFRRAVGNYVIGAAGYAARIKHIKDINQNLADLQSDPSIDRNMTQWAGESTAYATSSEEEWQWVRTVGFYTALGGRVSTALLQIMSIPQFAGPYLTQFASTPKVVSMLGTAFKDMSKTFVFKDKAIQYDDVAMDMTKFTQADPDLYEALIRAFEDGTVKHLAALEESGISAKRSPFSVKPGTRTAFRKFNQRWVIGPFSTMEAFSRAIVFITAYRIAKTGDLAAMSAQMQDNNLWVERTKEAGPTPYAFAQQVVEDNFGIYGRINRPKYMRGIGSVIFQFQHYVHQMFEMYHRMLSRHGAPGRKAFARMMLMMILTAGTQGLPFADDLDRLLDLLLSTITGLDTDIGREFKELLEEFGMNKGVIDFMGKGVFHSMGLDVQRRISMGNVPGSDIALALTETVTGRQADVTDLLGIPGSLYISSINKAVKLSNQARYAEAAAQFMPAALKDAWMSSAGWAKGVRTSSGATLVTPENLGLAERIAKGMGFTPASISQARETIFQESRLDRAAETKKLRIERELEEALWDKLDAQEKGNRKQLQNAMARMDAAIDEYVRHMQSVDRPEYRFKLNLQNIRDRVIMRRNPEMQVLNLRKDLREKALDARREN